MSRVRQNFVFARVDPCPVRGIAVGYGRSCRWRRSADGWDLRHDIRVHGPGPLHLEGTCHFLHLGLTTLVAEQTVIRLARRLWIITNTAVYTAANGDELHSSFVGTGTIDPSGSVTFSGTETFSGGTGRFHGALGSMTDVGTASLVTGTGQLTGDGSIVY